MWKKIRKVGSEHICLLLFLCTSTWNRGSHDSCPFSNSLGIYYLPGSHHKGQSCRNTIINSNNQLAPSPHPTIPKTSLAILSILDVRLEARILWEPGLVATLCVFKRGLSKEHLGSYQT